MTDQRNGPACGAGETEHNHLIGPQVTPRALNCQSDRGETEARYMGFPLRPPTGDFETLDEMAAESRAAGERML